MATKRTSASPKNTTPARHTLTLPAFPDAAVLDALRTFWAQGAPDPVTGKRMFRTPRTVWLDVITSGATLATITTGANRNAALRARAALDLAAEGTPAVLDLTDANAAVDENTVNKTHHGHGNPADPRGYLARALDTVTAAVLDGTNPDTGKPYTKTQRAKVEQAIAGWVEETRSMWDRSGAASTRAGVMLTRDGGRLTAYALAPEGYDPLAPVE